MRGGALEKNVAVVVNSGCIFFRAEPTGFANRLDKGGVGVVRNPR